MWLGFNSQLNNTNTSNKGAAIKEGLQNYSFSFPTLMPALGISPLLTQMFN